MLRLPLAIGIVATPLMLAIPVVGPLLFMLAGLLFGPVAILAWATAEHEDRIRDAAATAPADDRAAIRPAVDARVARTRPVPARRAEVATGL